MKLLRGEVQVEPEAGAEEEEPEVEDPEEEEPEEDEEETSISTSTSTSTKATSVSLTVQLQVIQLLHVLLPNWDRSSERQKDILKQLFDILAEHTLLSKPDFILETAHSKSSSSSTGNTF